MTPMTNLKVKYTVLRNNTYWLHFKLPAAIYKASSLSVPQVRYSLNTKDANKAAPLAQLLVLRIKEFCSTEISHGLTNEALKQFIEETLIAIGERPRLKLEQEKAQVQAPTLSKAFADYKAEALKASRWRAQTEYDNDITHRVMVELVGDIQVDKLTVDTCRHYRDSLLKYPVQRNKAESTNSKPVSELLSSGEEYQTLSLTTVNNHLRRSSTFLNWIRDQGYNLPNPLSRMKIKQTRSRKSYRAPFSDSDLDALFSEPVFTQHKFSKDYQFWVPLLGLYTGARLEELCQLHLDDIQLDNRVPHICIDDRFSGQFIKSESSRRQIPIHYELLELGFCEFVGQKKLTGEKMLFEYLIPVRNKYGHQLSKWFGRYKNRVGISDSRKVFHSFRHTLAERLRQQRINDYEIKAILGHSTGSITHDIYGSDQTALDSVQEALHELEYTETTRLIKPWVYPQQSL